MIPFKDLLPELIIKIASFCDPETKRSLTKVERRIQALVFSCIEKLLIFGQETYPLEKIVCRYKNLKKLKLLNWKGTSSTLTSLKSCTSLKVLQIHYHNNALINSKPQSLSPLIGHSWKDLTYLELWGLTTHDDAELYAFTKDLKQLKRLSMSLNCVSNEAIENLGDTCPSLEALQFSSSHLDNPTLNRLTQKLGSLKIIELLGARHISGDGIADLAKNCTGLEGLWIYDCEKMEQSGFDALINNCLNLKALSFKSCTIDLTGLLKLVEKSSNLSSLGLFIMKNLSTEAIEKFYAEHPKLKRIEDFNLNIGKMHQTT